MSHLDLALASCSSVSARFITSNMRFFSSSVRWDIAPRSSISSIVATEASADILGFNSSIVSTCKIDIIASTIFHCWQLLSLGVYLHHYQDRRLYWITHSVVTSLTINDDPLDSRLFFSAITHVLVIRHKTVNNYITDAHIFINN